MTFTNTDKWKCTFYTAFIFVLVFNHNTFKYVNSVLEKIIGATSDKKGCPTVLGFAVHTVVLAGVLRLAMEIHI